MSIFLDKPAKLCYTDPNFFSEDKIVTAFAFRMLNTNLAPDVNTNHWYPGGLVPLREILG